MAVPLCQLPSPVCTAIVTTKFPLSMCSVTYSAAAPVVSAAPFAPPIEVTPVEPVRKQRCEDSSEDRQNMLATFEELWAARKRSSRHPSTRLDLSSAPSAVTPPVSISAAPVRLFLLLVLGFRLLPGLCHPTTVCSPVCHPQTFMQLPLGIRRSQPGPGPDLGTHLPVGGLRPLGHTVVKFPGILKVEIFHGILGNIRELGEFFRMP